MTSWVQEQLAVLQAILDPEKMTTNIGEQNLFSEVDHLDDPLGEPPGPPSMRNLTRRPLRTNH